MCLEKDVGAWSHFYLVGVEMGACMCLSRRSYHACKCLQNATRLRHLYEYKLTMPATLRSIILR